MICKDIHKKISKITDKCSEADIRLDINMIKLKLVANSVSADKTWSEMIFLFVLMCSERHEYSTFQYSK